MKSNRPENRLVDSISSSLEIFGYFNIVDYDLSDEKNLYAIRALSYILALAADRLARMFSTPLSSQLC